LLTREWILDISDQHYLDTSEDKQYLPVVEEIEWARENIDQIDHLFSATSNVESTCGALRALLRSDAEKQWGPAATS
jgi:hypothetical protein